MMNKAYIVANKQQEREVLEKLEREDMTWITGRKPTEQMPSSSSFSEFPYVLFSRNRLSWGFIGSLSDEEIAFDGRKEEQMSEKYVVSQEFMTELEEWKRANFSDDFMIVNGDAIADFSDEINSWWYQRSSDYDQNNRLIAIIRWVNGEDVFEVEKPKKWVVRSKETDSEGYTAYVDLVDHVHAYVTNNIDMVTRFDTKEEAQSWANSHQEVVEVEE